MIRSAFALLFMVAAPLPVLIAPASAHQKAPAKMEKKEPKGRLPAYYAKIVDDNQREQIYKIQAHYDARIDALQAQLDALVAKRDAEIRGVLSAEQLRRLDALATEAQASKAAKAAKKAEEKQIDAPAPNAKQAKRPG
jgi:hypothetical protein